MSKHTPGPWQIGKNFGSVVCDTPVPGISGSDDTEYYGGHLIAESVTEANARLIAAAPELLEALRMFVVWYGRRDKHDTLLPPKMQEAELAQAMRAIAKAEGAPK